VSRGLKTRRRRKKEKEKFIHVVQRRKKEWGALRLYNLSQTRGTGEKEGLHVHQPLACLAAGSSNQ